MPLNIAHRGASIHAQENSLEAFRLAAELGADMIELDVRLTKDGVPVVLHDERLDRTCDRSGLLRDLTAKELRKEVRLLNGEAVPLLADVLDDLRSQVGFDIEIKEPAAMHTVTGLVTSTRLHEEVMITSFSPEVVAEASETLPRCRRALLLGTASYHPLVRAREAMPLALLRQAKATGVGLWQALCQEYLVSLVRRLGYHRYVWTVDTVPEFERFQDFDGIITNRCDGLARFLGGSRPE